MRYDASPSAICPLLILAMVERWVILPYYEHHKQKAMIMQKAVMFLPCTEIFIRGPPAAVVRTIQIHSVIWGSCAEAAPDMKFQGQKGKQYGLNTKTNQQRWLRQLSHHVQQTL